MLFKYMKLITIAIFSYTLFTGCDDTVSKVDEEDHLKEFIHHVEHDHFEGTLFDTISATADADSAPVMDSLFMVYRVVFSGTSGYIKYKFTDTSSHDRTLVVDKAVTVSIMNGTTAVLSEKDADLTGYTTEFIKMASVYELEPNETYTISVSGAAAGDTISFYFAPMAIDGEHHDH